MAMFAVSVKDVVWVADIGAADVVINKGPTTAATPRADVSVVMVILDEAPLFPLLNADGKINSSRFPGFASLANSSTWYRNNLGIFAVHHIGCAVNLDGSIANQSPSATSCQLSKEPLYSSWRQYGNGRPRNHDVPVSKTTL